MMYLRMQVRPQQRLSQSAKQTLQLMQTALLKLKHPDIPNMKRGLEGMESAHTLLTERGSVGLLGGSIIESLWNRKRAPKTIADRHKDVDVIVINEEFSLNDKFEGGVDWWLPQKGSLSFTDEYGSFTERFKQTWWQNGAGCVLYFTTEKFVPLKPGLYIPSPEMYLNMRECEARAVVASRYRSMEHNFDSEMLNVFKKRKLKTMGTCLPAWILERFAGLILADKYSESWNVDKDIRFRGIDHFPYMAIQEYKGTA